jgi:signal transduction histidine kinase
VLVIETAESTSQALEEQELGALVRRASPESVLAGGLAAAPDVIVIDAEGDGVDVERALRVLTSSPTSGHVPILVVLPAREPEAIASILRLGARDVMCRPFVATEILIRVRNMLGAKRMHDLLNETIGRHETDLVELATAVALHQRRLASALAELDTARREAETASRIKSNFLRIMSHELKTPVAAMQLHMQLIERDPSVALSPRLSDGFTRLKRSSRRLLHLVDTVLEWARVESGRCQLDVSEVELPALVATVTGELASYAAAKGVELVVDPTEDAVLPPLFTDPRILRLVLINIIERALQVTEHGRVVVTVRRCDRSQEVLVLDGAPAVGPVEHAELFDPLELSRDPYRASGSGSGLGLHIVRDLVRAADGDVFLEPQPETGNVVVVSLRTLPEERTTSRVSVLSPPVEEIDSPDSPFPSPLKRPC